MRSSRDQRRGRGQDSLRRRARPAFTLIELLVVIGILLILLAIAMPALAPGVDDRRTRETVRGVNAFFAGARDRAISSGRPFGVQIERFNPKATVASGAMLLPQQLNSSMALHYVEVPPPYSGDYLNSKMVIGAGSTIQYVGAIDSSGNPAGADSSWPFMVRPGDKVQIGYQGHLFTIYGPADPATGFITNPVGCLLYSDTSTYPVGTGPLGVPYQVFRAPVKSAAPPYQLPEGAIIDLSCSGVFTNEFLCNTEPDPITIMFNPSGGLGHIYFRPIGQPTVMSAAATGSIYLLIGEPEKVLAASGPSNWQDLSNRWVSINSRTGLIQSNEMAMDPTNPSGFPISIFEARRYAREKQGMGGR